MQPRISPWPCSNGGGPKAAPALPECVGYAAGRYFAAVFASSCYIVVYLRPPYAGVAARRRRKLEESCHQEKKERHHVRRRKHSYCPSLLGRSLEQGKRGYS